MADANSAPRRVSMAYILGFSDKPYKEVRPPAPPPPPQAKKHSHPTNMITTPGRIVEWTASDGRKGKLTGTGQPRLTAASLAKVPSEKRSTKEALGAKSTSKKATSAKPAANGDDPWGSNTNAKNEFKESGSNEPNAWGQDAWGNGNDSPSGDALKSSADAPADDDKKDETKEEITAASETPGSAPAVTDLWGNPVPGGEDNHDDANKDDGSKEWTKEQDDKLLQMKLNKQTWAGIAEEIEGKNKDECSDRWKQIKPKDWKPEDANKSGGGKGGESKKGKNKGKKQNHDQNQGKGDIKEHEKKDSNKEDKKEESDADNGWGALKIGGFVEDINDDKKDDTDKTNNTKKGWSNDVADTWGAKVEGGANGVKTATAGWDTTNDPSSKNDGGISQGFDNLAWPAAINSTSSPPSKKPPSVSRSQHKISSSNNNTPPTTTRPLEFEVKPDDTFSADDLRLVARILQQDCSMVWNRVSWRFRDKTGRTLHPDEFEKKITGRLEGKNGEKGERRR